MWGSKRHTASQPYNTFSGAEKNGTYPRPVKELNALKQWTPVLRDYCVVTDPNCAGGSVIKDHWNYFELYSDQATEWIKNQVVNNVTAKSLVAESSTNTTSSAVSLSTSLSSVTSSEMPATTQASKMPSAISQTVVSQTSTSSSGSAAATAYQINLLGLAVAVGCIHIERAL